MIGVGLAEAAGLIGALIRKLVSVSSEAMLTPIIIFIGVLSSVASDAGYLVLIPLGAAAFKSVGRNPLAGMAAAFAGVAAGFGVNFLITPLDGVLTEITNDASALVDPNRSIDLAANLYFGIASTILVTIVADARLHVHRRAKPRQARPVARERRRVARRRQGPGGVAGGRGEEGFATRLFATAGRARRASRCSPCFPDAPLRDPVTGDIIGDSPFMDSLIVIITIIFFAAGLAYGRGAGTIRTSDEVLASITKSWAGLASLLFLFLLIAQFIAYFNYSNMAQVAAVKLGDWLEEANIGAVWLLIGFVFVTMLVDFIMPAAIAKWAILAPIFIPLFLRLDVAPQTVLAAYRVGDSPLNVITPLMAYFPLIVIFAQRYRKDAGIGTVVSMMLPYVVVLRSSGRCSSSPGTCRDPARPGLARPPRLEASRGSAAAHERRRRSRFLILGVRSSPSSSGTGFPVAVVALGVALSLWATGVLDLEQALGGFGDPTVIFIASLFVVSEALDATGVTAWAGQQLIARAGDSRTRLIVLTMLLVAVLTALISVNGAVAALLPVVVRDGGPAPPVALAAADAARLRRPRGLAARAHRVAGQRHRLRGRRRRGRRRFGFFEFALVGVPLVAGTIAIVVLFGERLLPDRTARTITRDFGSLARTLVEQYALDARPGRPRQPASGVAEVVVPPRSGLIGETVFPGMVTDERRPRRPRDPAEGRGPAGETTLAVGDTLLLQGTWGALEDHLDDPDVLVVDDPALVRRQAVPLGPGAQQALVVLAGW